jgi:predicted helicase
MPVIIPSEEPHAMAQVATITLDTILEQFRDDARNNRDLGDRFERLMQQFFRVDPLYHALFSEVWMWNEWPLKGQVGDVGVDLVGNHFIRAELN